MVTVAMLLERLGSSALATEAVLVNVAGTVLLATTVTVTDAPATIVPTEHTGPAQVPWLGTADTKLSSAGSVSVTTTLVAVSGPRLVEVIVNVTSSPAFGVESL